MNVVGQLQYYKRNYDEAEKIFVGVRDGFSRAKGPEAFETLGAIHDLSMVYRGQGRPQLALGLIQDVMTRLARARGDDDPYVLTARRNYAETLGDLRRVQEMEPILDGVLKAQRKVLRADHPDTARSIYDLGHLYLARGQLDKAETFLREAEKGARAALDPNHEVLAAVLADLSVIYFLNKDLKRLGPVLIEARDLAAELYGEDNGIIANANHAVGKYYFNVEAPEKAEKYFRLERDFRKKTTPDDWSRFIAEAMLGASLMGAGKYDDAEPLLLSACPELRSREPSMDANQRSALRWTVELIIKYTEAAQEHEHRAGFATILAHPLVKPVRMELRFPADPFAPAPEPQ